MTLRESETVWREPEYCPLCGAECEKPDDPEHLRCPTHGDMVVTPLVGGGET